LQRGWPFLPKSYAKVSDLFLARSGKVEDLMRRIAPSGSRSLDPLDFEDDGSCCLV